VSEYGVHWNFFITLAAVTIMAALLEAAAATTRRSIPTAGFVIIGVAVVVAYEVALHVGQLQSFIFEAERDTLFQQNREGVCSLAGTSQQNCSEVRHCLTSARHRTAV